MARLHRLTADGIDRFQKFLDSQGSDEAEVYDFQLLQEGMYSEVAGKGPEVENDFAFTTRLDIAPRLSSIFDAAELPDPAIDRGVWCWLSWYWFEELCPVDELGRRRPKGSERWVLNLDYNRYYRHLLAGPWYIYETHRADPDRARALLCTKVTDPGELVGQIAAYQEFVSNPGLVEMVTRLYFDQEANALKRGHASKEAGGARRLVKVIRQLEMVWDLYSTTADEFMSLLPREFDRFLA